MGILSLLLWSLLGLYLAVTVNELYGLWRPSLTPRPGEHVFHSSWGTARHGSAEAALAQRYAWKLCVSSRESEITHKELESNCIFSRQDIQLNASTALQFDVSLPPRLLRPIVQLQDRYTELHDQLSEAAAAGTATPQMRAQLRNLKKQLLDSDLFLHSFFYRSTEPLAVAASNSVAAHTAALKADMWHVHSSTRLVARWIVPVNHTRSLLSSGAANSADVAAAAPKLNENGTLVPASASADAAASSKSPTPRQHLVHHLRPKFHFQFVGEDLSFPASLVPQDLAHLFPRRGASIQARKFYAPLMGVQDLLLMRREWRRLNASFLDDVDEAMAAAAANRTASGGLKRASAEGEDGVFTTTPATTAGVSDSQREIDAAAEAAAVTAAAAAAQAKVADSSATPPLYTSDGILLQVSLTSASLGWFRLLSQMTHSVQMLADMQSAITLPSAASGSSGRAGSNSAAARDADLSALLSHSSLSQDAIGGRSDFEQIKSLFLDANPWLLGLTFAVSLLHLILDLLAFKNDVKFWRERRGNFVGISARSVWLSAVVRTVIFLYLYDQDSTSSLLLFSQALSLAINLWKSSQILRISLGFSKAFPYVLRFGERPMREQATQSYDDTAMRYLSYIAAPLVAAASLWSLVYDSHKGWYSWVLSSLASAVYVGGFILMTPQLFINYKLQSVSHLPLRVFVYRALNTFIDDLFAFVVPMPWMHRLACFRDDIIFFVYLYQRWIYPVDHSRTSMREDEEESAEVASAAEAAAAGPAGPVVPAVSGEAAPLLPAIDAPSNGAASASAPTDDSSAAPSSTLTHRHAATASESS